MNSSISSRCRALWLLLALSALPGTLPARTLIEAGSSAESETAVVSTRFQREFDAAGLQKDERLVILVCASDGEIVFLNGREVGRVNMPDGPVDAKTLALAPLDERRKRLFMRLRVPPEAVRPGEKNVIEAEVHSAMPDGSRLSFDLALKTLPAEQPLPLPGDEAKQVLKTFRTQSYIAAGTPIPDGYFDGGRNMVLDAEGHATSGREILLVDRTHDPELAKDLDFARKLRELPPLERTRKLSLYVDQVLTPAGGAPLLDAAMDQLQEEFVNKPLRIGDVRDQYHAGVCRHRALFFKILADEAGLKTALARGLYVNSRAGAGPHAWNEVQLDDGHRYLVDTMIQPKSYFPEITGPDVTHPEVVKRYVKLNGTPYYGTVAPPKEAQGLP